MIDIKELRKDKRPQSSTVVHALLDRLEAAESECLEEARLNGVGSEREAALMAKLEAAEKARDDVAQQLVQSERGKRAISESTPKCAWSFIATTAPTKISHRNRKRDNSSVAVIPELNA